MFLYILLLRHHEKTLGEIYYDQVMQHSVSKSDPPSPHQCLTPDVWTRPQSSSPSVWMWLREHVSFCVWMSSISILRGGCVCLTNRNNTITKSMDSTSSLSHGSRYTCCPVHSWPQPPLLLFSLQVSAASLQLHTGLAYFTVDSTI